MTDEEWRELFKKHGHSPKMDEDDPFKIDMFAMAFEIHNGPMCSFCYASVCVHCDPNGRDLDPCDCIDGHLVRKTLTIDT